MAMSKRNTNAMVIMNFLYRIVEVFEDYFTELVEESIRDNFVITYELLDEMMDFGYPQSTEPKVLKVRREQQADRHTSVPKSKAVRFWDNVWPSMLTSLALFCLFCPVSLLLRLPPVPGVHLRGGASQVRREASRGRDERRQLAWRRHQAQEE